jgi:hypothetical protein
MYLFYKPAAARGHVISLLIKLNQGLIKTPYLLIFSIKFIVSWIKLIQSLIKFQSYQIFYFLTKLAPKLIILS